jgi:hypothetical protein
METQLAASSRFADLSWCAVFLSQRSFHQSCHFKSSVFLAGAPRYVASFLVYTLGIQSPIRRRYVIVGNLTEPTQALLKFLIWYICNTLKNYH